MNTTAMISPIMTAKPTQPATTLFSSGLGSEAAASATMPVMAPVSQVPVVSATGDAGEQVVLRQRALHVAGDQLVVLGRPGGHLQLARDREPEAVGVDLGRVRQERLIADAEEVTALDPSRQALVPVVVTLPALQPLGVRRLQPVLDHRVVDRLDLRVAPAVVVVELERLPRLTGLGEPVGITGRRERRQAHLVTADVVGVRV